MQIEGYEINYLSDWDGLPVKNHLPQELKDRFKTEKQWLEYGKKLKEGAIGTDMHPNAMNKKLCTYFLETQVEDIGKDVECCATCTIRRGRFCDVMGEHVSMDRRCSEWCG